MNEPIKAMTEDSSLKLSQSEAEMYIPDGGDLSSALSKTTHLGVGAHQDDLEFMALHGILECRDRDDLWFGGITCTDGAGSARQGPFADTTDEEMQLIRAEEQREASRIGGYAFMAQLGHPSSRIKNPETAGELVDDLAVLLQRTSARVLYTHNLADKHGTHIAVTSALIKAIRQLPKENRPERLIGCEVWRDLDWLADDKKVVMDLGKDSEFAARLNGIFKSQISGGKRYDLAVEGRRRANATFHQSHSTDTYERVCFGMDLTPLITDDDLSPAEYTLGLIRDFEQEVAQVIGKHF
jgi:LmbE family N-acetylglucosaminyl deacetylase